MKIINSYFILFFLLFNFTVSGQFKFKQGNEVLIENIDVLKDKRIAVLTNQTGILPDGSHIIDILVSKGINIVKIFSPEHGIRGDENYASIDKSGIPVVSLYGGKDKPSNKDLNDIDILIYDIQDVGSRFYTYTSTLKYAIEAAIGNNKKMIICDRPIIINPEYVDGFILEPGFESFVGSITAPVCYGMTCGELAGFIARNYTDGQNFIEVSKMQGYSRLVDYDSLNLLWIKPSPNMFTSKTAVCYPMTCFLEGTNVSEGRGTPKPFEYFGAPWVDASKLAEELNSYNFKGVVFEPVSFTPNEKISAYAPKFFNQQCNGVYINVTDKKIFEPVKCSVAMLAALRKLFPEFKFNKDNYIDKLVGTDKMRLMINSGADYNSVINLWQNDLDNFKKSRSAYLLYN